MLSQWRVGHRASRTGHRVQLQPDLSSEPESRQDASTAGTAESFHSTADLF